jgi:DNA polymerase elongation subunit (family B)
MSIQININQIESTNVANGTILHIFGRDESGNAHRIDISGYRPYFYAPLKQADTLPEIGGSYVDIDKIYYTIKGQELRRIYTIHPNDIREIRSRYQHFEGDIPFGTKFMLDFDIKSGIEVDNKNIDCSSVTPKNLNYKSKVCIADIECEDHRGFPEPDRDAIIAITAWDSFSEKYITYFCSDIPSYKVSDNHEVRTYSNETDMLNAFSQYMIEVDPDIITGWNFIEFDLPYILKRMTVIGLDPMKMGRLAGKMGDRADKLRGRVIFDLLTAYKRIHVAEGQEVSYRLDAVAEHQLGEHKVKYDGNLTDLRRLDPKKLVEYNWKDVELCVKINNKNHIIDFYKEIAIYVGMPLDKTLNSSNVVDYYVLRQVIGKYVLPSRGSVNLESFEGATVFDPYSGLDENVCVLDAKSLYPMSMMTINASPETKDPNGELHSPNGVRFKKNPDGLARTIIMNLLKERDEKKRIMKSYKIGSPEYELYDMQQNVLKVIMNTYYGVSGYPKFRLYDHDIGGAVTSTGRALVEFTKKIIQEMGYKVIYGDSVTGDMKIIVYNKFGIFGKEISIKDLFTQVDIKDGDKEYCNLHNVQTWTVENNFKHQLVKKDIKYIMRHKTTKQIYRVICNNNYYVDVTEDHSLISLNKKTHMFKEIKPINAVIGETKLITYNTQLGELIQFIDIKSIQKIKYTGYVYDIEVQDTHKFFANNVLVHNTDSNFVLIPGTTIEEIIEKAKAVEKKLNESYAEFAKRELNADVSYFSTKFEKLYKRYYQGGKKKRYAGNLVWKEGQTVDKIDIVGFEFKRSDSSKVTKNVQQTLITMILRGEKFEDIQKYMRDIVKNYKNLPLDDIGIPGGLGKSLNDYAVDDAQVRGCKYANDYLSARFLRGSKPKRVYIKNVKNKYPKTDVICFEYGSQVPPEFVIDYDIMIEKTLKQPISRVVEPLGWKWSDFDPYATTLSAFGLG